MTRREASKSLETFMKKIGIEDAQDVDALAIIEFLEFEIGMKPPFNEQVYMLTLTNDAYTWDGKE